MEPIRENRRRKKTYEEFYRRAQSPQDLPWHREQPPALLARALDAHAGTGRALDLGCGTGIFAVYLAVRGFQVTALDFVSTAVNLTRERAARAGMKLDVVESDVLAWSPAGTVDVIFDSGCLHSLPPRFRADYAERISSWLRPGGDYVLVHFGRRHFFDWRPIGPRRRTRAEILGLFGGGFEERGFESEIRETPLPVGPSAQILTLWLRKK